MYDQERRMAALSSRKFTLSFSVSRATGSESGLSASECWRQLAPKVSVGPQDDFLIFMETCAQGGCYRVGDFAVIRESDVMAKERPEVTLLLVGLNGSGKTAWAHAQGFDLLEHPTARMHPRAQVAYARALAARIEVGEALVIETHSDHLLSELGLQVAQGLLNPNRLDVLCFTAEGPNPTARAFFDAAGILTGMPVGFMAP